MKFELKWALIILFMILLAIFVPYTILSNIATWYGSFLFWIVITIIVLIMNFYITKDWGK